MKPEILSIGINQDALPTTNPSQEQCIFDQMRHLGINPDPFIEIAAHDLLSQYGDKAQYFAKSISCDFYDRGDFPAAEIWKKIDVYLSSINGPGELIAH